MNTLSDLALDELLKTKSVAIFSDLVLNPIFSAVELELLARLAESQVPTTVLTCTGLLPWCFQNTRHSKIICKLCIANREKGQNQATFGWHQQLELSIGADRKIQLIHLASEILSKVQYSLDLVELTHQGVLIGPGICSTLSFSLKNSNIELASCMDLAVRLVATSLIIVEALPEVLKFTEVDALVVGNGRLATNWAASRVAESMGVKVFSYENLPTQSFYLAPISPAGDMENVKGSLRHLSQNLLDPMQVIAAESFFEKQRFPETHKNEVQALTDKNIFLGLQTEGNLPAGFDSRQRNIAVFISSEWEFAGLPGWENHLGMSQVEILKEFLGNPALSADINIWVRFHPHQQVVPHEVELTINILGERCRYILPEEATDSYALLEACEKIITFGSTLGAEATYWGTPSILCGRAEYETLDISYNPQNHEELVQLINSDLKSKERTKALPYGLLRLMRGVDWNYAAIVYPSFPLIRGESSSSLFVRGLYFLKRLLSKIQYETTRLVRRGLTK